MRVDVDVSEQDLLDFNLFHMRHSETARRQRMITAIVPAAVWIGGWTGVMALRGFPTDMMPLLLPAWLAGVAYALYVLFAWQGHVAKVVRRFLAEGQNQSILGPHRLTVEDVGLLEEGPGSTSRYNWNAIERIITTPTHAFIYTSAVTAVVIPRRAFPDDAAFSRFIDTVEAHRQSGAGPGTRAEYRPASS